MVDITKLEKGLEELTGYDFEDAERAIRQKGDMTPDITFSKNFQTKLAAKAMGITSDKIKAMGIREYVEITTTTSNFLLGNLVAKKMEQDLPKPIGK